jgi:cytochrome c oxidase subunit 2
MIDVGVHSWATGQCRVGAARAGWKRATRIAAGALWARSLVAEAVAQPQQSALQPAGVQAAHIAKLWNLSLIVCGTVFALVLLATLVALIRNTRGAAAPPRRPTGPT